MKPLKSILYLIALLLAGVTGFAQSEGVSIKTTAGAPDPSAMLDIVSGTKGLLVPRVNLLSSTNSSTPVTSPANGLLVFNLTSTLSTGVGFYYWDQASTQWTKVGTGPTLWTKIGTTNDIQYNNTTTHKVIIGNSVVTPTFNLEVLATSTDTYACKFDAASGTQMRFGYYDLGGGAGAGPASYLTVKSATSGASSSVSCRLAHLMSNDEMSCALTSYGKTYGTKGTVTLDAFNNDLFVNSTNGNVIVTSAVGGVILTSASTWGTYSDSTLKTDIVNQESVLAKVGQFRPVKYRYKTQAAGTVHHGLIAQEVESIFPELVTSISTPNTSTSASTGPKVNSYTTKKVLDYTSLVPILLKAIQEQQATIDSLKTRVHALDGK